VFVSGETTNRPTDQPTNRPTDQPTNRPTIPGELDAAEGKIYNFGVYKLNSKRMGGQRRILQLDFQASVFCNIANGKRHHQIPFGSIERIESEDGVEFAISFAATDGEHQHKPHHYEADTLEEKNQIFRLISLIVNHNRTSVAKALDVDVAGASPCCCHWL
jgi:hypothetical protein